MGGQAAHVRLGMHGLAPLVKGLCMKNKKVCIPMLLAAAMVLAAGAPALGAWNGGHDVLGANEARKTWYFAEGTTRGGFHEYVCILNPGERVALADLTYMLGDGRNIDLRYDLAPGSRTTIDVNTQIPPESDASIRVTASEPVVAERSMYFDYKGAWSGGHDVAGAAGPLTTWYFAEGCTREGFDTYLCLANPAEDDAVVDIEYYCADGQLVERNGVRVGAKSRFTAPVHEDEYGIGRHNDFHGDASIKVRSTNGVGVIAERPMYFNYKPYLTGGHDVVGAAGPEKAWYFAEGSTRDGFDTFLCLGNPGAQKAKVNVYYYCGDGNNEQRRDIEVAPHSRFTIPVHETANGIGRHNNPHGDFSIRVESANGIPVVAERPVYFFYKPFWSGGHDVMGALEPGAAWYFAEGCTRQGYDTYLSIANTENRDASVNITYFCGDGSRVEKKDVAVPRESRSTVAVHDPALGIGRSDDNRGDVSIKVESANGVKVVAERPVYFADRWRTMDRNAVAGAYGWGEVFNGNTRKNTVALTFDMETNGATAARVLDILQSHGVRATCFVTGGYPGQYPSVVTRMAAEGHEIASHGVSHAMFTRISYAQVESELAQTEAAVNALTGFSTKPYFRFPYGDRNAGLINFINSRGYLSVYWSVDPQEWSNNSVAAVQANVLSNSHAGSIILMHDRDKTVAALPGIIDGLRARGLEPVTLTEVLYPGP